MFLAHFILCKLYNLANDPIGFFNIVLSLPYLSLLEKALYVVPIYVFVQRVHSQTQQRAFKAVSDELVKINDYLIEFLFKLSVIGPEDEIDSKTTSELLSLKSKINAHIIYMHEYIDGFPYGGPLNYICFITLKRYLFKQIKAITDELEMEYQELILNDTVLSLEKDFIENKKLKILDEYTIPLKQKTIDDVVDISRRILEHLEKNTRKIF